MVTMSLKLIEFVDESVMLDDFCDLIMIIEMRFLDGVLGAFIHPLVKLVQIICD